MSPISYYVIIRDENHNELVDHLQYADLSEMLEFLDEAKVEYVGNKATIHTILHGETVNTVVIDL